MDNCPPCADKNATISLFKQESQYIYAFLDAVTSYTTEQITSSDIEDNTFILILVEACTGWTDVQIMRKKSEAGRAK